MAEHKVKYIVKTFPSECMHRMWYLWNNLKI